MSYIDLPLKSAPGEFKRIKILLNYFIQPTDNYIGCDTATGNLTLLLPPANTVNNGHFFVIKDEGGHCSDPLKKVFITSHGTDKIDGSNLPYEIQANYESVTLVCNGVGEWFVI